MKIHIVKIKNNEDGEEGVHSLWDDFEKAKECQINIKTDSSLSGYNASDIETLELNTANTKFTPWHEFTFKQSGELVRHRTADEKRIENKRCWTHKFNDVIPHDPEIGGCISVFVITDYAEAFELAKQDFERFMKNLRGTPNV